jgi:uncharacterized protein YdeI (YjbR/CyaY-like superfamily)
MKTFYAKTPNEWRGWLDRNHLLEREVWLIFYKKDAGEPCIDYDDAVGWALCYGWIDSIIKRIDDKKYTRKFTPRKSGSIWSKSNIERVNRLIKEGKMTEHGMALFEKRNKVSFAEKFKAKELPFPPEFLDAIKKNRQAWQNFQKFAPSHKRQYQMWITSAKKADTRERRIKEAVNLIGENVKSLLK